MPKISCLPLTPDRWTDFATLFGPHGACGGCWCMLWRLSRRDFEAQKGDGNRKAMRALVKSGQVPGILGYCDGQAVGWCAIAPRIEYPALARSRILQPVDERPCWSVACLFVERGHRKTGVSVALLRGAVEYAAARGARLVEGYPVAPKGDNDMPAAFAWTGTQSAFLRAGFKEVARRSPTRPIMRRALRRRARAGAGR